MSRSDHRDHPEGTAKDERPAKPIITAAAVWTRADALRAGHQVLVRHGDEDLWARVTRIESGDESEQLHVRLEPVRDGAPLGEHTHLTPTDTAFLRRLP